MKTYLLCYIDSDDLPKLAGAVVVIAALDSNEIKSCPIGTLSGPAVDAQMTVKRVEAETASRLELFFKRVKRFGRRKNNA